VRLDFGNQGVVQRDAGGLFGGALVGRGEQCAKGGFVQPRMRRDRQVAHGERGAWVGGLEAGDDAFGDAGGVGALTAGTGVDLQNVHGGLSRGCR
jgi:hypothetical protein